MTVTFKEAIKDTTPMSKIVRDKSSNVTLVLNIGAIDHISEFLSQAENSDMQEALFGKTLDKMDTKMFLNLMFYKSGISNYNPETEEEEGIGYSVQIDSDYNIDGLMGYKAPKVKGKKAFDPIRLDGGLWSILNFIDKQTKAMAKDAVGAQYRKDLIRELLNPERLIPVVTIKIDGDVERRKFVFIPFENGKPVSWGEAKLTDFRAEARKGVYPNPRNTPYF